MEHRDHRHEHVVHRHVGRGGDERTGFRHAFQSPCAHFAVPPHDEVAARQQASRRLRILRFDFRGVGLARSGREIMGGIDQMMLRRELRHLRVAQRFHGGTWRRFSFGCHGFHCATARRYGTQTVEGPMRDRRSAYFFFLPHPAFFCTILPSNDAENHADEGAGRVTRMERSRHSQPRHNKNRHPHDADAGGRYGTRP